LIADLGSRRLAVLVERLEQSDQRTLSGAKMTDFIYDVAISFAGEDRRVARDIATRLLARNYRVFYDEFYRADLLGVNLRERLGTVYGEQSKHCIIVVSESYATKVWTQYEFKSAMDTALLRRRDDYIIPLRLDDAELSGLRPTISYLDLRELDLNNPDLEGAVEMLVVKLGPPPGVGEIEPATVTGVDKVLSLCYRRSIFTRYHAQLSLEAMFASMGDCRVALQKQIIFVRPREAQQLVASIIAELELVERVHKKESTGDNINTMGIIDGAKLRIIAAMRTLAKMSGTPLELPTMTTTEEVFWTQEDADAAPSGPYTPPSS
jgi:TIR domain